MKTVFLQILKKKQKNIRMLEQSIRMFLQKTFWEKNTVGTAKAQT